RHTDIIGRIGGDEIAILDDSLPVHNAVEVARSLSQRFAEVPHKAGGQFFKMSVSAGVTALNPDESFHAMVERAQQAVRHAKQQGKNQ
ncbi:MAG TPA: diguanylate cyclase, partial [Candidatus Melainabacteria bacterium]|nr:diguanylate cyclase [Candidatus Melainabacteria bacterium]